MSQLWKWKNKDTIKKVGTSTTTNIYGEGSSYETNFLGFFTFLSGNATTNSHENYRYIRKGICQSCGYNYDYIIKQEIDKNQKDSKINLIISIILFAILITIVAINFFTNRPSSTDTGIWATEYTSIKDFDYYIDGNKVYLKEYEDKEQKVRINHQYKINGNVYIVESFAEPVFSSSDVTSIILPDTLTSMPNNALSSSNLKYIYIPASLQQTNQSYLFYNYFHDMEIIYYGGTEEQWKILTNNANRSSIDAKEIRYNANVETLIQETLENN